VSNAKDGVVRPITNTVLYSTGNPRQNAAFKGVGNSLPNAELNRAGDLKSNTDPLENSLVYTNLKTPQKWGYKSKQSFVPNNVNNSVKNQTVTRITADGAMVPFATNYASQDNASDNVIPPLLEPPKTSSLPAVNGGADVHPALTPKSENKNSNQQSENSKRCRKAAEHADTPVFNMSKLIEANKHRNTENKCRDWYGVVSVSETETTVGNRTVKMNGAGASKDETISSLTSHVGDIKFAEAAPPVRQIKMKDKINFFNMNE